MKRRRMVQALGALAGTAALTPVGARPRGAGVYDARAADWRNGAVVYQVLVDRFVPPADPQAKAALYPAPKVLRHWDEEPRAGRFVEAAGVWSHEIDFWGGDLQGVRTRLDYLQQLGATVVYLNPIHLGYTNHKYDALDFEAVSPEFGSRADVQALARDLHRRGMKLVLDGVFNHMGRQSPRFKAAAAGNPTARPWFVFGPSYPGGARTWKDVANLPELNLEHGPVRDHLWRHRDSVVRRYLRDGVDGWRLDTAYELGPEWLGELTRAAHAEKPGSVVIGEIVSHPGGWMPALDGVMNFYWRTALLQMLRGGLSASRFAQVIDQTVSDVGIEPLLKSWLVLDNHDVPRLATELPDERQRRLAQVLQFTLPGAPNLYYGVEVGMQGGGDPEQRGPMRWDRVAQNHPDLGWIRSLTGLRQQHRALGIGDFRRLGTERLLAFERHTDRVGDTVLVAVNPSDQAITEVIPLRNGQLMDDAAVRLVLRSDTAPATAEPPLKVGSGFLTVTLPPWSARVWAPDLGTPETAYSVYKRVR